MTPILWAGLVALGVAVASMAVFAARLTRRQSPDSPADDFVPSADPDDPWAAYRPRPFEDVERRRPRVWPAVASVFGLVLVAGGVVGARQSTQIGALDTGPTTRPYIVDVKPAATPDPTLPPTPSPAPAATAQPVHPAAARTAPPRPPAAPPGAAPKISASGSCSGGVMHVSVNVSGTKLAWFGLYLDGKAVKGGPISGSSYSTTYSKQVAKGTHAVEAAADDAAHHHGDKPFTVVCA
jgi:hypothetical protein